jgi:ZIP family zinc transporter
VFESKVIEVCLLSLLAGLCTGIGAFLVMLIKKPGKTFLGSTMGFASGVMLIVALLNLTQSSIQMTGGYLIPTIGFLAGAFFILAVDKTMPHIYQFKEKGVFAPRLYRVGMLMAIGMAIHNIPEGLAVGVGYAHLPALGGLVALAIAFHNIPEGVVVGIPLYAAGLRRRRVFTVSLISGLVEPLGAIAGISVLAMMPGTTPLALALAFAGGVMTYLTVDELIPTSHHYGHEHAIAAGLISGLSFAMFLSVIFGV